MTARTAAVVLLLGPILARLGPGAGPSDMASVVDACGGSSRMDVLVERVAGLDGGKEIVVMWVRTPGV